MRSSRRRGEDEARTSILGLLQGARVGESERFLDSHPRRKDKDAPRVGHPVPGSCIPNLGVDSGSPISIDFQPDSQFPHLTRFLDKRAFGTGSMLEFLLLIGRRERLQEVVYLLSKSACKGSRLGQDRQAALGRLSGKRCFGE